MDSVQAIHAPFLWYGGKSLVAEHVWAHFGNVQNYVEPFAGSLAVLLARPHHGDLETVNDLDSYICNAWRAIQHDPDGVAKHADQPVYEADLHARHIWLVNHRDEFTLRIQGDPFYYDAMVAGWWLWGVNIWIGGGWCSGLGPWNQIDGKLVQDKTRAAGVARQRFSLSRQGVHRKRFGNEDVYNSMNNLARRLKYVRVLCGDWSRALTYAMTTLNGVSGIFLDPPYSDDTGRSADLYGVEDYQVSHAVREWCLAHGDDPMLRIALCGHEGEHDMPETWTKLKWKASGPFAKADREVIWFSPHCLKADQLNMWSMLQESTE